MEAEVAGLDPLVDSLLELRLIQLDVIPMFQGKTVELLAELGLSPGYSGSPVSWTCW